MKKRINVGDLVHVPSDVILFSSAETYKLNKPISLLVIGEERDRYEVLFEGNSWYVDHNSVYELKEEKC